MQFIDPYIYLIDLDVQGFILCSLSASIQHFYLIVCRSVEFILHTTKHMLGLIGQTIVGRLNGYQCLGISTRASTCFHNGIDNLLSILSAPTSEGVCARELIA
jgi:hypothetical protein